MTLRHRIRFYQQLAVLVRAGLPIRSSLERLKERMHERQLDLLAQKVNAGERLGESFVAAGFSPLECHLVVAGERSAQLDSVFDHLSEFFKRELAMQQALIRPLYYPIFVLHLAILIGAAVEAIVSSWPLAALHMVAQLVSAYVIGIVLFFVIRASWTSALGRRFWRRTPIVGSTLRAAAAYRWITALKFEFIAGIPLSTAVGDAWRASDELDGERFAAEGEQGMRAGTPLSQLMHRWNWFPQDWTDFIETGEVSGALEVAFNNLEQEASQSWKLAQERMMEWLPKILYFIVLLIVAVKVGTVMYQVEVAPIVSAENALNGK